MATTLELFPSDALLWLEFGGIYTDSAGNRVIDNLSTRGDAPARVTCGAGAACPTQLSGRRGIVFAGAQWIDCGLVDPFERTDRFTLFACMSGATSTDSHILSSMDQAQTSRGISLNVRSATVLAGELVNTTGNLLRLATSGTNMRIVQNIAMTYGGTSLAANSAFYVNGTVSNATAIGDTLSATVKSGKSFLLGARHNGTNKSTFLTGTMHFAAIFPLAASPLQIANLHKRVMRRIQLP